MRAKVTKYEFISILRYDLIKETLRNFQTSVLLASSFNEIRKIIDIVNSLMFLTKLYVTITIET